LIQRGELGELVGIEGYQWSNPARRLPAWYENLPLGLFYDESPHLIYLIRDLAGCTPTLLDVNMVPSRSGKNTPYSLTAAFQGGHIPIRLSANFDSPISEWHLMVLGTRKIAVFDIFRDLLVTAPNDASHKARNILYTSFSAIYTHLAGTLISGAVMLSGRMDYGTRRIFDRFLQSISQNNSLNQISAEDGLAVIQMQHQIIDRSGFSHQASIV
jgi:scyllo-inositol 2-dehydrogenase (NADP+)